MKKSTIKKSKPLVEKIAEEPTILLENIIAPVILILIVLISSDKKIMGEHANGKISKTFGWLVTGTMVVAGVATIISLF